ncbi:MAG: hypothetical protein ACRYGA_16450 [Janthinobacterium lividum]
MKTIDSAGHSVKRHRTGARRPHPTFHAIRFWLLNAAFFCILLPGTRNVLAQDLPRLDILPVTISAGKFIGAGKVGQFELAGATADNGYVRAGSTPVVMNLKNVASPGRSPTESHFILGASDSGESKNLMAIDMIATNQRCLLTTIDPVLAQYNESGRIIMINSILIRRRPLLDIASTPISVCTMESGKLFLSFSTPTFDMVQVTAVSFGTPSSVLRSMNSQSAMLYFPFVKF